MLSSFWKMVGKRKKNTIQAPAHLFSPISDCFYSLKSRLYIYISYTCMTYDHLTHYNTHTYIY